MQDTVRFRIGEFECFIVSDGTFVYPHPGNVLFANAPRGPLQDALAEWDIDLDSWDSYVSPYPSLFIDTGAEKILVDVGAGPLGPSTGQLVKNLNAIGVAPADLDIVVLTHAHPDHIGGVLDDVGRPTFPNAQHMISRTEYDFWMNSPDLSPLAMPEDFKAMLVDCAVRNLSALPSLERINSDKVITPGIQAFDAAGHTPGQIGLRLSSADDVLFAVADAIVHPAHARHPDWSTAIDYDPDAAVATRRRTLRQVEAEQALLFAFHFPSLGVGTVSTEGDGWKWRTK